jgi:hypothetical protein
MAIDSNGKDNFDLFLDASVLGEYVVLNGSDLDSRLTEAVMLFVSQVSAASRLGLSSRKTISFDDLQRAALSHCRELYFKGK